MTDAAPAARTLSVPRRRGAASRRSQPTSRTDRADDWNVANMTIEPTPGVSGVSQLFQLLRDGVPRTRAELAKSTGLARSTIAARVDELMRMGLITPDRRERVDRRAAAVAVRAQSERPPRARRRHRRLARDGRHHRSHRLDPRRAQRAARCRPSAPRPVLTWVVENADALLGEDRPLDRRIVAAIGIGVPGSGRALDRAAGQSADHARVGPLRRAGLGAAAPRRARARRQRREHHGARRARDGLARRRAPHVRQGRDRHRRRRHLGRRAAARRAGHRGRHRPRAGRARRRRAVPLRQHGMPRGSRLGPRDRPRAARAGRCRPRTATTSSTSSSAATSTPSRRCVRRAATSARCSRRA